jgi:hypothetical protein
MNTLLIDVPHETKGSPAHHITTPVLLKTTSEKIKKKR